MNINRDKLIKDVSRLVWNKYIATPKNEHRDMQFSYDNLKKEIASIIIDYTTPQLNHKVCELCSKEIEKDGRSDDLCNECWRKL